MLLELALCIGRSDVKGSYKEYNSSHKLLLRAPASDVSTESAYIFSALDVSRETITALPCTALALGIERLMNRHKV